MTQTDQQTVPKLRFPGFDGEWKTKTLDDIADILSGFAFKSSDFRKEGKHKIIRMSDLKSGSISNSDHAMLDDDSVAGLDRFKLHPGDFLFGMSGSLSNYAWVRDSDGSLFLNQRVGCIREKEGHSGRFAQFLYLNPRTQKNIEESAVGAAQLNISTVFLKRMRFSVPTLPEQRKIASFLGAVDTKITQLSEKKRLLQDYKKGCMQQLFSQKIRFKDDTGNDFPDWEEKRLGELCRIGSSKRVLQKDWQENGIPFLRTREIINLSRGEVFQTPIFISNDLFEKLKSEYGAPKYGDILATGVGSIGETYIVKPEDVFYFKDGNVLWIHRSKYIDSDFLNHQFRSHRVQKQIMDNASITTVATFTIDDAKKLKVQLPHRAEQRKIADFLSALDRKIDLVGAELEHARTFKKGLLQQMFV
jgi:type I restriction enzyme S subunit